MSNVGPSSASVGRFAVLGPGGVGGLLAALLARSGATVVCLARGSTAQSIATAGIRVESAQVGASVAPLAAAERLSEPVDVCLVTLKATQLAGALDRLQPDVVGSALIVPLLNGVDHVELLRQHYPDATVVPPRSGSSRRAQLPGSSGTTARS
jgi:2-dehydropantoate 2-reductase